MSRRDRLHSDAGAPQRRLPLQARHRIIVMRHPTSVCLVVCGLLLHSGCAADIPRAERTTAPAAAVSNSQPAVARAKPTARVGGPVTRPVDAPSAAEIVAQIRNQELEWVIARWEDGTFHRWVTPRIGSGGPAHRLVDGHLLVDDYRTAKPPLFPREELVAPLLRALDDPDRFVIAHAMLARLFRDKRLDLGGELVNQPGGTFAYVFDGLAITLRPVGDADEGTTYEGIAAFQPCTAAIDRAQLPAIREQWRRRFEGGVRGGKE